MSVIGSNILAGASGQGGGYNLTRSLRFRSSASASLTKTFASAGNRKTWTFSVWLKKSGLAVGMEIFGSDYGDPYSNPYNHFGFQSSPADALNSDCGPEGSRVQANTTAVYRDPSAWYHVVIAFDTTQATASNRIKYYVNGVQQTMTGNFPSQNYDGLVNSAGAHSIGVRLRDNSNYFNGYMTEVNFIDGQALTPSSFGATSPTTGVWQPKKYAGTYGTNGFYLPFTNNASTTTLGNDFSGNGNNWTTNNISLTAGATYDSMTDVPTLTSATASNFAVMNPLIRSYSAQSWALTNGNLQYTDTGSGGGFGLATISATSGKWYWEGTVTANAKNHGIGWTTIGNISFGYNGCYTTGGGVNNTTGGSATTFATYTTNDVIGVAVDVTAGKVWFSKNGTFLGSGDPVTGTNTAFTFTGGTESAPTFCIDNSAGTSGSACNFGQRPFAYTPPTGFVALNTFNLPTPTIGATASTQANKYFDVNTYTGNNTTNVITNSGGMQPDFVWMKRRDNVNSHALVDVVRGTNKQICTDRSGAEETNSAGAGLQSFNSNGFTLGTESTASGGTNISGATYVAWQWDAGTSTVTNTSGSISSQVRANTSSGFSIVTYTGNGTAGATVGHGLGVAPSMLIVKSLTNSNDWFVYNRSLGATQRLLLNGTNAANTNAWLNNTHPSSTVFTLNNSSFPASNGSGTGYVAYCYAQIAGFSSIGIYVGNGSTDGPFVYTGFRPKYVMIKADLSDNDWKVFDAARNTSNPETLVLYPNIWNAEDTNSGLDFTANGFKIRDNGSSLNGNGAVIVYAAFAETPTKYSLAR